MEKEVDEFLVDKIYGSKVAVTNCSAADTEYQILVELPNGAIPVKTLDYTKSHNLRISSYGSITTQFYFYFPHAG